MLQAVIPKKQLLTEVKRFIKDKDRGISLALFAELCGIHKTHLLDVFFYRCHPLTEYIQIRVSKGYTAWKNGEVAIMQRQDKTRYVEYRRAAKPRTVNSAGLQVVNGAIKIKLGVRNLGDYSGADLDEQLKRG
jgi:hypothetical protein